MTNRRLAVDRLAALPDRGYFAPNLAQQLAVIAGQDNEVEGSAIAELGSDIE